MPAAASLSPPAAAGLSWWYGRARAATTIRALEQLAAATPPPPAVGVCTVGADRIDVAFIGPPRTVPAPWALHGPNGATAGRDTLAAAARAEPPPTPQGFFVTLGASDDGIAAINLAFFNRLQIRGDRTAVNALLHRWIIELVITHPATRVAVTTDAWPGPFTTRIQAATKQQVPAADVLIVGAEATYAQRARIFATTDAAILIDLGDDAAGNSTWKLACEATTARLTSGTTAMDVSLITTSADALDRCRHMLAHPITARPSIAPAEIPDNGAAAVTADEETVDEGTVEEETPTGEGTFDESPPPPLGDEPARHPDPTPAAPSSDSGAAVPATTPTGDSPVTAPPGVDPAAAAAEQPFTLPVIWTRILGKVELCPPHGGAPGDHEITLSEIAVLLQTRRYGLTADDIRAKVSGGAMSHSSLKTRLSGLRTRLGTTSSGASAFPHASKDTAKYQLAAEVVSDWNVFDMLVDLVPSRTSTANLAAALQLVTGPPLAGMNWPWAADLLDQITDRVPAAALELAGRHLKTGDYPAALRAALAGLHADDQRQDLWVAALTAATHDPAADVREIQDRAMAAIERADRGPQLRQLLLAGT